LVPGTLTLFVGDRNSIQPVKVIVSTSSISSLCETGFYVDCGVTTENLVW